MKKFLISAIVLFLCLSVVSSFPILNASAGSSDRYLLSEASIKNGEINTGDADTSGGVYAIGNSIVFDETCDSDAYVKTNTKVYNMKEYGEKTLFSYEVTLKVTEMSENGKIHFLLGLDIPDDGKGSSDMFEIAVTYSDYLIFTLTEYDTQAQPELIKQAVFGKYGYTDNVVIRAEADVYNRITVYIGDMTVPFVRNRSLDINLDGYFSFEQTGVNCFTLTAPKIVSKSYETPENIEYTETFNNGEYNANVFYSRTLNSSFDGASLSVKDGKLVFNNTGDSFISTKYAYSNFELTFDMYDLRTEPLYKDGKLIAPITTFFGIAFGCDSYESTAESSIHYDNALHFEAGLLGCNATIPYGEAGCDLISRYVLYENGIRGSARSVQSMVKADGLMPWDRSVTKDRVIGVKFSVIDGVVTLQYKLDTDPDYRAPNFVFDMGSTQSGYVRIFTFGTIGSSDLEHSAAANFKIDNLTIKNMDYVTVKKTVPAPEFKSNLLDPAEDFDYADTSDSDDLLANKIKNGNEDAGSGGCSSVIGSSLVVTATLLLSGVVVAARKMRRR